MVKIPQPRCYATSALIAEHETAWIKSTKMRATRLALRYVYPRFIITSTSRRCHQLTWKKGSIRMLKVIVPPIYWYSRVCWNSQQIGANILGIMFAKDTEI